MPSYVLLVAASSVWVGIAHTFVTGHFRGRAKVPFPNAYASANEVATSKEKFLFNCAQRAHAQFLEHYPLFLTSLAVAGLRDPTWAAGLGASWIVARFMFLWGYTRATGNENGRGRYWGGWYQFPQIGLMGMAMWTGWKASGL